MNNPNDSFCRNNTHFLMYATFVSCVECDVVVVELNAITNYLCGNYFKGKAVQKEDFALFIDKLF